MIEILKYDTNPIHVKESKLLHSSLDSAVPMKNKFNAEIDTGRKKTMNTTKGDDVKGKGNGWVNVDGYALDSSPTKRNVMTTSGGESTINIQKKAQEPFNNGFEKLKKLG